MKPMTVIITLIAIFSLTACNTMAGFGKDIQQGGEAIERSAQ
ncbi:MAG: entericidin A/B family lipoprotein [Burkholderiales bacterium]|nr:entericidin A/B family lipoprotein [Nitrosomonas sp.]MCP5273748.1 entericidin A/B family lipoprotein [Burkholderiales bacterium]MDR4518775.1 entericidin A/B family lipoprotein [Nitrosomonas sp.]